MAQAATLTIAQAFNLAFQVALDQNDDDDDENDNSYNISDNDDRLLFAVLGSGEG